MNRNLLLTATAFATTATLLGGCGESAPVQPAAPEQNAPAVCVDPQRSAWEAILGHPELPCTIGSITANTVELDITSVTIPATGGAQERSEGTSGSGTIVNYKGMKIVIGAAHVGVQAGGHCEDQKILVPANGQDEAFRTTIKAAAPIAAGGSYNTTKGSFDATVIVPLDGKLDNYPGLEPQATVAPQPGATLFAMGYGRRWDVNIDPSPMAYESAHTKPVVVAGSVVQVSKSNKVIFVVGAEGYEPLKDATLRRGDSGGTTVDGHGNYWGAAAVAMEHPMTGAQIESEFGADMPVGTEDKSYYVAASQLVDAATVGTLLASTHPCSPAS